MKNIKIVFIFLTAFLNISCFEEEEGPTEPLNEGRLLSTDIPTSFAVLKWSKHTNEIITASSLGILAVDISSGSLRNIESSKSVYNYFLSHNGYSIYYFLGASLFNGIEPLYKISFTGTKKELLATEALSPFYAVSRDSLIAYIRYSVDSVFIHKDSSKTKITLDKLTFPRAFSPDGKYLLCYDSSFQYFTISINDKVKQPIALSGEDAKSSGNIRWDEDGIKFVQHTINGTFFRNITTGETFKIIDNVDSPKRATWSADGKKVAYWTTKCVDYESFNCKTIQSVLHVIDIASRVQYKAAVHLTSGANESYIGSMSFSHDNKRIAYILGYGIYINDVKN